MYAPLLYKQPLLYAYKFKSRVDSQTQFLSANVKYIPQRKSSDVTTILPNTDVLTQLKDSRRGK